MTTPSANVVDKIAVVVPAFNAARHLTAVIDDICRTIPAQQIIVVDDGSTDETSDKARKAGVNVVEHTVNQGKGAALSSGAKKAVEMGMDYVVTLDADGQHDPAEIPKFIEHAQKTGADIILGNRMKDRKDMPFIRVFANRATSAFVSLRTGKNIPDSQNGYRMLRTWVFDKVKLETKRYDTESEILIKAAAAGASIDSIPVQTIYGSEASSVNPVIDTMRFFRMVFRSMFW
ncbi:MAG: glycosyltransferase family 2 protein [Candidatus Krumholzibacteria bacterium]|nr:glycosyltransferase family 2 protein [Candidatus Krumholzibacteria bacterium]